MSKEPGNLLDTRVEWEWILWNCMNEACECIRCISDGSQRIHEIIKEMDSTFGIPDGIFWIRTAPLFSLTGERMRTEICKEIDKVCSMWLDAIGELLARDDESVLFVPVQARKLTIEDRDTVIKIWIQFFRKAVHEGRCKNRRDEKLRIEINYLEKWVFSIVLCRLHDE